MMSAVSQNYWDALYEKAEPAYDPEKVPFRDLFQRYLRPGGSCFEVGCYPGNFLIYLGRQFDYTVGGIDATPFVTTRMPRRMREAGVKVGEFLQGDFLTYEGAARHDVVCSFGFVEHFYNFEEVIERHVRLVKEGGTLVLSCPNFRKVQFLLHRLFDSVNLRRHVLAAMDLARWRKVLERNGMSVLFDGYSDTADFWVEDPQRTRLAKRAVTYIQDAAQAINKRVKWPNSFTSPYMVSISRKVG